MESPPDELIGRGYAAFRQGRDAEARELFDLARDSRDRQVRAQALGGLARVALRAGETERTRELALGTLELAESEAAEWGPRHLLAAVARAEGDYELAEKLYTDSLARARRLDLRLGEAAELLNLGFVAAHRGHAQLATERFRESLEIGAELDDDYLLPYCLLGAASSEFLRGDTDEGARLLAAAKAAFDRAGAAIDPGSAEEYESMAAHIGHDYEAAWAEGSELSLAEAVARARRARPA